MFELASNNPLVSARFLIRSYGAIFLLAKLFRMTLSIISRLFMNVLIDATINSSSYSLGVLVIQPHFVTYNLLVPFYSLRDA